MAEGKGHTELPWKWHPKSVDQAHNGAIYSEMILGHAYAVAMQPRYVTDEQWKANANLIVTAVNTYPAVEGLVKAVSDLLRWVEPIAGDNRHDAAAANEVLTVEQVKAALSRFRSLQNGGES